MLDALRQRVQTNVVDPALKTATSIVETVLDRVRRHRILGEIYELVDGSLGDYARDHGPMYAGALAFYAILSLIPLIILLASVSGFALAGGSEAAVDASLQEVMVQIRKVIPYIEPRLEDDLRTIIANRKSLGAVGFIALMLSASEVFRAIEFALARIFARLDDHDAPDDKRARPRSYLASKLFFGAFVTALVLAFIALRLFAGILRHMSEVLSLPTWLTSFLGDPLAGGSVTGQVATAVGIVLGFVLVMKTFTHKKVHARFALVGGALFYLLFQAAHAVYDLYLARITNVGAMYGSFATLIIIVLWMYFSATLLLICCHVVKVVQRRVLLGPRWLKDKLTLW
jgi:YihY family inner membrane protein